MNLWDVKAPIYDWVRRLPVFRRILEGEKQGLRRLLDRVERLPPVVLDLGMGAGSLLDVLNGFSCIVGLDQSFHMIRRAARRGIVGMVGDACRLPVASDCLALVSAIGLAEYIGDAECFLEEIRQILKPGGMVLLTIAPPGFLNRMRRLSGHRLYLLREAEWESLVERLGFSVIGRECSLMQAAYLLQHSSPH